MKTTRHHTNDEQPDDHENENPLRADGGARETFEPNLGARVLDREAADPNTAVVVALPDEPAYERTIDALDVWREASPDALAAICEDHNVRTYDFVTARLRPADEFSTAGEAGGDAE